METTILSEDIKVYCITAKSFPDGIKEAHEKLHSLITFVPGRKYLGISYPDEKGNIIYKAAANELTEGELSSHGLEKFIVKKGDYLTIPINDYMKNIPQIGNAFQKLIADKRIDPNGVCVEWYFSDKDMKCMVRMADK